VINFVTEQDEDLAKAIQNCAGSPSNNSYESHFSRNRQFRWRLKKKQLRKMNRQTTEGFASVYDDSRSYQKKN